MFFAQANRAARKNGTPMKKPAEAGFKLLAERVGFEPTVRFNVRLISSQVHSTTLPPLLMVLHRLFGEGKIITGGNRRRKPQNTTTNANNFPYPIYIVGRRIDPNIVMVPVGHRGLRDVWKIGGGGTPRTVPDLLFPTSATPPDGFFGRA